MRFVDKIGLEIEGGWGGEPGESPFDFPLKRELSVPDMDGCVHVGEAATPSPLPSPADVEPWLTKHWPKAHDSRCGMHVHVSVKNPAYYAELATREFFDFCIARLEEWGKAVGLEATHIFWHRMGTHGNSQLNRFCRRVFDPTSQMKVKNKQGHDERRGLLNYCYDMHGTLECRVFPMFTEGPAVAASGALAFVNSVEDYLRLREFKMGEALDLSIHPRSKRPTKAPPRGEARRVEPPNWRLDLPVAPALAAAMRAPAILPTRGIDDFFDDPIPFEPPPARRRN